MSALGHRMGSVRAIIVNYRTAGLAVDCLRSLAPEVAGRPGWRATVVDGGSADGSAERLLAAVRDNGWGGWCEVLPLLDNRGFAAGNNAAVRPALAGPDPPDYLWLLNPDTVVRPGAARALVNFLNAHPRVGVVGSRLEHPDGTPQRSAFRFPGPLSEFEGAARTGPVSRLLRHHMVAPPVRDDAHRVGWVAGASMMVRRAVFELVGLMDEGYFLYYEETDLCRRAARAGWPTWYVPASRVVHLVGQSSGLTNADRSPRRRLPGYWFESRRRYFRAAGGRVYALLADAGWLAGHGIYRVRAAARGAAADTPEGFAWDLVRYSLRRRT